jgi:hypothetical protein
MLARNRRGFEWFSSDIDFADLAGDGQTNLLLYNAIGQGARFVKGATVTRMIIDLRMRANAVAQTVILFWGIVVVNADARAAGAFPEADDLTDRADWLIRGKMQTIQASLSDSSQWDTVKLDIKSQRVLRAEEDELHLILDSRGANVLEWTAFIRVLMRMP